MYLIAVTMTFLVRTDVLVHMQCVRPLFNVESPHSFIAGTRLGMTHISSTSAPSGMGCP